MVIKSTLYLTGFIMLGNAGLSMLNCKQFKVTQCIDRRTSGLEEIKTPIDIKFELIVALLVLMFASAQSYMGSN